MRGTPIERVNSASGAAFETMLASMIVDSTDAQVVAALRVVDAPFRDRLRDAQLEMLRTGMAMSISSSMTGNALDLLASEFQLTKDSGGAEIKALAEKRQEMLSAAYPEFAGNEEMLTYISIGGGRPGEGRIVPLNRRDHPAYFDQRDRIVRTSEERQVAWREVLDRR